LGTLASTSATGVASLQVWRKEVQIEGALTKLAALREGGIYVLQQVWKHGVRGAHAHRAGCCAKWCLPLRHVGPRLRVDSLPFVCCPRGAARTVGRVAACLCLSLSHNRSWLYTNCTKSITHLWLEKQNFCKGYNGKWCCTSFLGTWANGILENKITCNNVAVGYQHLRDGRAGLHRYVTRVAPEHSPKVAILWSLFTWLFYSLGHVACIHGLCRAIGALCHQLRMLRVLLTSCTCTDPYLGHTIMHACGKAIFHFLLPGQALLLLPTNFSNLVAPAACCARAWSPPLLCCACLGDISWPSHANAYMLARQCLQTHTCASRIARVIYKLTLLRPFRKPHCTRPSREWG